jgi:hypothetical protein
MLTKSLDRANGGKSRQTSHRIRAAARTALGARPRGAGRIPHRAWWRGRLRSLWEGEDPDLGTDIWDPPKVPGSAAVHLAGKGEDPQRI